MTPSNDSLCAHLVAVPAHQVALRSEEQELSYGQLRDAILVAARVFRTLGVEVGDRVAMLMLNEPEILVNLFALNALGAALLPMNSRLACAEWTACLEDAGAELVIFDDVVLKGLSHLGRTISLETWRQMNRQESMHPCMASPTFRHAEFLALANEQSGQTLALLVYTSGTTGRAKGVMHSGAGLVANAHASWTAHAMRTDDTVISVLPLFHVGGLCIQTLPALLCGATVVLQRRFLPADWLRAVEEFRVSLALLVPAVMQALLAHPNWLATDLSSLRLCMAGSSIVPLELIQAFHARHVPCGQVYGSTESGPVTLVLAGETAFSHEGAAGWPALNVEVKMRSIGDDVGELIVRAPNLATGYWNLPLDEAFENGWFHTGDLARRGPDGAYWVVGRCKEMIISGGENIFPAELELLVNAFAEVQECAAVGVPDPKWGEALVLYVVLREGHSLSAPALLARLEGQLARFKWPRHCVFVGELPKTALGKVQKSMLIEAFSKAI